MTMPTATGILVPTRLVILAVLGDMIIITPARGMRAAPATIGV